jgi:chromate reductase, NAD(P)H dehydrogenase (quinone)
MTDSQKTILGISGSLRKGGLTERVLGAVERLLPEGASLVRATPFDRLPHFSTAREAAPSSESVSAWRREITDTDAVLIVTPEYAYGLPGSLKNALDWLVGSGELLGRPVGVISASPNHLGAMHAQRSLLLTLHAMDGRSGEKRAVSLPSAYDKLGADGSLCDPDAERQIRALVVDLLESAAEAAG